MQCIYLYILKGDYVQQNIERNPRMIMKQDTMMVAMSWPQKQPRQTEAGRKRLHGGHLQERDAAGELPDILERNFTLRI